MECFFGPCMGFDIEECEECTDACLTTCGVSQACINGFEALDVCEQTHCSHLDDSDDDEEFDQCSLQFCCDENKLIFQ